MTLEQLPRHIFEDVLERVCNVDFTEISDILRLRLVNRHLDAEVVHAIYDQDIMGIHNRDEYGACHKPVGLSLERVIKGFMSRPKGPSEVVNVIWKALRDAALILSILLESNMEETISQSVPTNLVTKDVPSSSPKIATDKGHMVLSTSDVSISDEETEQISEETALKVARAYIQLLGDERAFDSLNTSWARSPEQFQKLETKTGHFWAFLAAVQDGRPNLIEKAANACINRFSDEADLPTLKMHLAAGLLVAAKDGDLKALKQVLSQPATRINLRFQNIRFAGENAMEVAMEKDHNIIVQLLLDEGWNFTTVPLDYIRALKVTAGSMTASPTRRELLRTLLEGSCQEWRSDPITNGVLQELSKRGDLETSTLIVSLLKKETVRNHGWQWNFEDRRNEDYILTTAPPTNLDEEEDWSPDLPAADEANALYQSGTKSWASSGTGAKADFVKRRNHSTALKVFSSVDLTFSIVRMESPPPHTGSFQSKKVQCVNRVNVN